MTMWLFVVYRMISQLCRTHAISTVCGIVNPVATHHLSCGMEQSTNLWSSLTARGWRTNHSTNLNILEFLSLISSGPQLEGLAHTLGCRITTMLLFATIVVAFKMKLYTCSSIFLSSSLPHAHAHVICRCATSWTVLRLFQTCWNWITWLCLETSTSARTSPSRSVGSTVEYVSGTDGLLAHVLYLVHVFLPPT